MWRGNDVTKGSAEDLLRAIDPALAAAPRTVRIMYGWECVPSGEGGARSGIPMAPGVEPSSSPTSVWRSRRTERLGLTVLKYIGIERLPRLTPLTNSDEIRVRDTGDEINDEYEVGWNTFIRYLCTLATRALVVFMGAIGTIGNSTLREAMSLVEIVYRATRLSQDQRSSDGHSDNCVRSAVPEILPKGRRETHAGADSVLGISCGSLSSSRPS